MKEAQMVEKVQEALVRLGIDDQPVAAAVFEGARLPGFHVSDVIDALRS